jgi:hypothetical protein
MDTYERLANGSSFTGEFLVDEVESALTLTGVSAAYLVELALSLSERLPGTLEALRAGLIDVAKAKVIVQGTAAVSAESVERQVLDDAPAQTTSELRSKVARAVIAADPEAADKRRRAAEAVLDDQGHPIGHGETRYRPSPALRRKVEARNPVCVFPQCRRPARACDLDHTTPHHPHEPGGGITCGCNLAPLCRRHHRLKQSKDWHLDQPQPGHYRWTTPSGKHHHTTPEEQPL